MVAMPWLIFLDALPGLGANDNQGGFYLGFYTTSSLGVPLQFYRLAASLLATARVTIRKRH